jgi:hypothetical protein
MSRLLYQLTVRHQVNGSPPGGTDPDRPPQSIHIRLTPRDSSLYRYRVYEVGIPAPAWTDMTLLPLSGDNEAIVTGLTPTKVYRVEVLEGSTVIKLADVSVLAVADFCFYPNNTLAVSIFYVFSTVLRTRFNFQIGSVVSSTVSPIGYSFDGTTFTELPINTNYDIAWATLEAVYGLDSIVPVLTCKIVPQDCLVEGLFINALIGEATIEPLAVTFTQSNVTTAGGSDGSINVVVSGGSGSYTVEWADSVTTSLNRTGLPAGAYSVTITDSITSEEVILNITITQPTIEPETSEGTLLEVPFLNSLRYVVNPISSFDSDTLQTPDNSLFCQQYFPGFKRGNYYQKLCKTDRPITQFNSDYLEHVAQLVNYKTNAVVKTFSPILKEQNIGVAESFGISIRNHTEIGQSRVLFSVGAPPIPVSVGQSFEIINNADGFDGTYAIVDIVNDPLLGYAYLVINLIYTAPGTTSSATGIFLSDSADYNVYEFVSDFLDVASGHYYIKIIATDSLDNSAIAISEPIDLQVEHKKSLVIEYRNEDNDYGNLTWTTGYIGMVRVDAVLFKAQPGGERSITRDADGSLIKINAQKTRGFLLEFYFLPPYLLEKLSYIFDCDSWTINKVPYQSSENLAEPEYFDKFKLAHSSIKIEQQNFNKGYNSDDIGSVNDGGFLVTETGFIKL